MGTIKPSPKAHPFVAVMFKNKKDLSACLEYLQEQLGDAFPGGPIYRVTDFTKYYVKEFGELLLKQFFVFRKPVNLEDFYQIKIQTNNFEFGKLKSSKRILNIDPGYLEPSKLVLFSTKNFSHRIYCGKGIYAEVTMTYAHDEFVRLPWTYNDYYWEKNRSFLKKIRDEIVCLSRSQL